MGVWLFCCRDARHGAKQKDIIRKFAKSFCFRDAQHGGKHNDIICKFERQKSRDAPAALEARPTAVLQYTLRTTLISIWE